jgi:hypothetical protein
MNRIRLVVCLTLLFEPLLAYAGVPVQYEITAMFIEYPTNDAAVAANLINTNTMTGTELDRPALPASWNLLSAPRVTTVANQAAEIRSYEYPQYLEKQSDGSFQLRRMSDPEWVGVAARFLVKPENSQGDQFLVEGSLKANWIQSRETISNVFLDVGKPVIVHDHVETIWHLKSGQWSLITTPGNFGAANRSMMLLFRVQRVDPRGLPY